ncbi:MAG: hypothetical protein J7M05_04555 [Anaerolineae bacterium]|nr:hypothetical protein [Anaerolineae bacterium]
MRKIPRSRLFCPNEDCPDFRKRQTDYQRNIVRLGKTWSGKQVFRCRSCGQVFTEDNLLWVLAGRRLRDRW